MSKLLKVGKFYHVIPVSEVLFEVENTRKSYMTNNKKSYVVNLEEYTCDCGLWQISDLPCSHAMPCIAHLKATYESYIALCFTKEPYLKCYLGIIHHLSDKSKWPHIETDEILPLNISRPPSRPKTCRRRTAGEAPSHRRKFTVLCIYCKSVG